MPKGNKTRKKQRNKHKNQTHNLPIPSSVTKKPKFGLEKLWKLKSTIYSFLSNIGKKAISVTTLLWAFVVCISVILSVIAGIYTFQTKITVVPEEPFNTLNPYNSSFTISNEGLLPLYDINVICISELLSFEIEGKKYNGFSFDGASGKTTEATLGSLNAGEKRNINCVSSVGIWGNETKLDSFGVNLSVKYRPIWGFERVEKIFKFDALRNIDGKFLWKQKQIYDK